MRVKQATPAATTAARRWWLSLDRRRLPPRTPRTVRVGLALALLIFVCWNLVRDVAYLRTLPIDDIFAYECYARAFWHGPGAIADASHMRLCAAPAFKFWVAPPQAFHTLPREYPAPALALFSLPLLATFAPYDQTFMVMMAVLTVAITAFLAARGLFLCAAACALYVLVGGWATALARFDLVLGVLAVLALVLAERRHVTAAFLVLAAATLLKVYPAFLVPVVAVHAWRMTGRAPWRGLGVFVVATVAGLLPGALLDPAQFFQPLTYNSVRPPQIESVAGSLLWLSRWIGGDVQVRLTYHSLNVTGVLAGPISWLATLLLVVGLAVVCRRAWRGQDNLARSFVLTLLVVLCGSKLLSPQYLLWVLPLAAYAEGLRLRWTLLAVLTVAIYPHAYGIHSTMVGLPDHPFFMGSVLARNLVLVTLTLVYLDAWRRPSRHTHALAPEGRGAATPALLPAVSPPHAPRRLTHRHRGVLSRLPRGVRVPAIASRVLWWPRDATELPDGGG